MRALAAMAQPSPAALRRCADALDALSPLGDPWLEAMRFERAMILTACGLNLTELLESDPAFPSSGAEEWVKNVARSAAQWKLRTSSIGSPDKNRLDVYREFDALMVAADGFGDVARWPEVRPRMSAFSVEHERRLARSIPLYDFFRLQWGVGGTGELRAVLQDDDAYMGIFVAMMMPALERSLNAVVESERERRYTAAGLRLLADRLEGKPYPDDPGLIDPATGEPVKTLRRGGFYVLYAPDMPADHRLLSENTLVNPRTLGGRGILPPGMVMGGPGGPAAAPPPAPTPSKVLREEVKAYLLGKAEGLIERFVALPLFPGDEGADEAVWRVLTGAADEENEEGGTDGEE
jgi:hypothetical protein